MAQFEVGLARAQARVGVIPASAAETITDRANGFTADLLEMGASTANAAVPTIALVQQMRAHIDADEARYLHWGATSQDVIDTALVLRLRTAIDLFEARLCVLIRALCDAADTHRQTVMLMRTRYQQALPTSLGLKLASWLAPLPRQLVRLRELKPRLLVVQLGGAVGTLSAMGKQGVLVAAELARELQLGEPEMHWHSQRDNLAEFASWLSILTGVLGKLGQDIALHQQSEVGEFGRVRTRPAVVLPPCRKKPIRLVQKPWLPWPDSMLVYWRICIRRWCRKMNVAGRVGSSSG